VKNEILKRLERIEGRERGECPNVIDVLQAIGDGTLKHDASSNDELERIMKEYYEEKDKKNASNDELESNIIL
jgi:hypothetical protein